MIEVKEVITKKDYKLFFNFPLKLYKKCPYYTPPLYGDDKKDYDEKRNPNLKVCKMKSFLAFKDGVLAGRISCIVNPLADEKYHTNRMRFRHFDVIDDIEVTKALFKKVIEYAKENNLDEIEGPNGFTDFDKEGMLYEGFEERNIFITYYNYPYYIKHMEQLGLQKQVDWFEYRINIPQEIDHRLERIAGLVKRKGFNVIHVKSHKELTPYIHKAFKVYNEAFERLYGTVYLSEELVDYYMGSFLYLLNMDYLSIVENSNHEVVGFAAVVPSLSKASKACNGKLFPFGWINLLHALHHNDTIDMLLIAVKPGYQGLGVNAILMNEVHKACIKHHIRYAETGPELELNNEVQNQWKTYERKIVRRRRLFYSKIDDIKV